MPKIYSTAGKLEAHRLRNFLAQRDIEAEIRETAATERAAEGDLAPSEWCVWVAVGQANAAAQLLNEFRAFYEQASETSPPVEESDTDLSSTPLPSVRARVPWLTILFCLACALPTLAIWRAPLETRGEAFRRWGWRDSQEVADGSYWAVLTSPLLHKSLSHLGWNLFGIAILGIGIERAFGRLSWTTLTITAILVSTAGELAVRGQHGIGASGIVYAFFGFVLIASVRRRILPLWLMLPITGWLLYGAMFDLAVAVDHQLVERPLVWSAGHAHLSGAAWGVLFALAFVISWRPRLTRAVAAAVLVASLIPMTGTPWVAGWLESRADRAYGEGNIPKALHWYSRAAARQPTRGDGLVSRGLVLLNDGRIDEALADFDRALQRNPTTRHAHACRALILDLRSRFDEALVEARLEFQAARDSAYAYAVRGVVQLSLSNYDAAIADVDSAIELDPRVPDYWISRSDVSRQQSRFERALAAVDQALWLDPNNGRASLERGLILSSQSRHDESRSALEQAHQLLRKELDLYPNNIWNLDSVAQVQCELFEYDSSQDRLDAAAEHVEKALRLAPRDFYGWQLRGSIEFRRKNFARAEQDLSRALELNPRDAWSAFYRGLARQEMARSDDALRDLDQALALNPLSAPFHRGRALVLHASGGHRSAVDELDQALKLNPRFAEAWQLRGQCRIALGEEDAGRADLHRAVELDPRLSAELDGPERGA